MSSLTERPKTTTATTLDPAPVNVRVKIAALWTAMMFVFGYVDLFSLYRADVRGDLEVGRVSVFSIGQGFLLGVTAYIAVPSLMVFLSLALPAQAARWTTMVLAVTYILTIVGGTVGESHYYYVLGSAVEVVLLVANVGYAWTWPRHARPHVVDPAGGTPGELAADVAGPSSG
jgi:hypothetical protein